MMTDQAKKRRILQIKQMSEEGIVILDPDMKIVPEPNTWYKVADVWPTAFEDVIFCDKDGIEYIGTMDELKRFIDRSGESIKNVVAWMPAPEAYSED